MKAPEELQKAVESYKAGNREAFEQVYNLSHKYLYVCIRHIIRDDEAAVDMLQETYLEISRSIGQLNSIEDFLNWAAVIAKRKCYAYMNKNDKYVIFSTGKDEEEQDIIESVADNEAFIPESIMQDREKSRLIMEIIDGLSDMQRLCVIAYFYNEQTQEEIAEELGIPVNTVKSHINRAKVKIKEEVLTLEREKDTKLYAIIPFMLLYFAKEVQDCEAVPMPDALANLIVKPESDSSEKKGGKLAKLSTKAKLLIGTVVFIGAAAITGAVIMSATSGNEQPAQQELAVAEAENEVGEIEEIPETVEEPTILAENEEEGYAELPISGVYDELREGRDGIIVARSGEKWGLVTYDNEILVPFEYDVACQAPNDDGQTFFGNEGDYRVFDREGNEIFTTDKPIKAVSEGVVLWFQVDEREIEIDFGYVKLDGTVLYESDGEDVYLQSGAVGFNEGHALFATYDLEEGESEYLIETDGTFLDIFEKRDRNLHPELYQPYEASGAMGGSGTGTYSISYYPIGACYQGYYVDRGMNFEGTHSIFWLNDVEGTKEYLFWIRDLAGYAGYSWWEDSDLHWAVTAFYNNGNYCYSAGTIIAAYIGIGEERKYYLIDVAKQEAIEHEYGSETAIADSAVLAEGEYIEISDTTYWLTKKDGKWGYLDHDGNIIATFDDASRFYNGQAMVIEDGYAHFIDEDMNPGEWKIPAESVGGCGEVYVLETPEGQKCFVAPET